jgi:hypothetical protein
LLTIAHKKDGIFRIGEEAMDKKEKKQKWKNFINAQCAKKIVFQPLR